MTDLGIFEGYMEIPYKEGERCRFNKGSIEDNPYDPTSEMGKAWIDGFNLTDGAFTEKDIEF